MHSFLLTRFLQNLSPRRAAFHPQIFLKSQKIQCTASFGVAVLEDEDSCDSLLAKADSALYLAKDSGRNCVRTS